MAFFITIYNNTLKWLFKEKNVIEKTKEENPKTEENLKIVNSYKYQPLTRNLLYYHDSVNNLESELNQTQFYVSTHHTRDYNKDKFHENKIKAFVNQNKKSNKPGLPRMIIPPKLTRHDKPLILFDLSGTLTNHTSDRYNSGTIKLRPGLEHLLRLRNYFDIGIYSCATYYTVQKSVQLIKTEIGTNIFKTVLERRHCQSAPKEIRDQYNKWWAKTKPLAKHFHDMTKVVLIDDTIYKSLPKERKNLVLIDTYKNNEDDTSLKFLVDTLIEHIPVTTDVRVGIRQVNKKLRNSP
jgi:hypothetical protein